MISEERQYPDPTMMSEFAEFGWRSVSPEGSCVEVSHAPDGVGVRDSKNPGPAVIFKRPSWTMFLIGIRRER
jgi:hypothetical protein